MGDDIIISERQLLVQILDDLRDEAQLARSQVVNAPGHITDEVIDILVRNVYRAVQSNINISMVSNMACSAEK